MHNQEAVVHRLKNVEGHIRGVEHMVEEGVYCIDILRQIQAVQAALNKISVQIEFFGFPVLLYCLDLWLDILLLVDLSTCCRSLLAH